jgi:hypothetical protein
MDTLPLPPRPSLAQYRKRTKDLVKAATSTEPDAVRAWATDWLETLDRLRGGTSSPFVQASFDRAVAEIEQQVRGRSTKPDAAFTLGDAQFLIARTRLRQLALLRLPRRAAVARERGRRSIRVRRGCRRHRRSLVARVAPSRKSRLDSRAVGSPAPRDPAALRGRERRRGLPAADAAQRGGDREGPARGRCRGGCPREYVRRRKCTDDDESAGFEHASRGGRAATRARGYPAGLRRCH